MSYIIAVVGAGGKSAYIERLADEYAARGRRVCVTTTTRIYRAPDRENVFYRGATKGDKLAYPGDGEFLRLRHEHDVVLVEADGAHHRPLKIPADYEPVIPRPVDKIVVLMGLHAIGRPVGEVCHRFGAADVRRLSAEFPELDAALPVTPAIIDLIADACYIKPLRRSFPSVPIEYVRSDLFSSLSEQAGKRAALILLTSGSSRRFGGNKLLHPLSGKELFRYGLDSLLGARRILSEDGIEAEVFLTGGNHLEHDGAEVIANPDRLEGISASIRHGTQTAMERRCDAALFLAGDQPNFPADDIARLVREFVCSGKTFGCAYSDHPANPGIFASESYPELLELSGDEGAMRLIRRRPQRTHYYVVSPDKLLDIDAREDMAVLRRAFLLAAIRSQSP